MDIYEDVFKTVAEIPDDIDYDILDEMAEQEYVANNYPWLSAGIF